MLNSDRPFNILTGPALNQFRETADKASATAKQRGIVGATGLSAATLMATQVPHCASFAWHSACFASMCCPTVSLEVSRTRSRKALEVSRTQSRKAEHTNRIA